MSIGRHRGAFTLIEVLIVVVIMAVLAATIIPQFTATSEDAQDSTLNFNMRTLRSQIELYKMQHSGDYPDDVGDATGGWMPQMTGSTNASGTNGAAGDSFPFGPYVEVIPDNPYDGKNAVTSVALSGAKATAVSGTAGGWQYDPATGDVWPNNTDFDFTTL